MPDVPLNLCPSRHDTSEYLGLPRVQYGNIRTVAVRDTVANVYYYCTYYCQNCNYVQYSTSRYTVEARSGRAKPCDFPTLPSPSSTAGCLYRAHTLNNPSDSMI